ncbi:cytochrome c [Methylobacterium sp. Leaf456]|uniref:c-type cytochrome n=1 Tax=Methylobacterium sp. Leaf456 TaxID=1736382 RepID=UPI0012E35E72|nr:cytochrome c [Methylobacterium sp. Leaf456]
MAVRKILFLGAGFFVAISAGWLAVHIYKTKLYIEIPDYPPVDKVYWLNQGWSNNVREKFHHADQGTQTLGIPYEWFVALEQPRIALVGDVGRLNDPIYLDRYGFIPGGTIGGETPPPIGFAKSLTRDMRNWNDEPWLNPETGKPLHAVGFTCAACHTGRLTYGGNAIIVDGGSALTDLGKFRQAVGISILYTYFVPGRFDRFADNLLGESASPDARAKLRKQVHDLWNVQFDMIRKLDKAAAANTDSEGKNVDEGFGRLDALNRIGNQVFGIDQGENGTKRNYVATSAPVNYPHIWMTSWFDWVQYNASIMQPMVRNAGQALGVSARLNLDPAKGTPFKSGVRIDHLYEIEAWLSGADDGTNPDWDKGPAYGGPFVTKKLMGLRAPSWPGRVLPELKEKDLREAARGWALYEQHCQECHRPPVGSPAFWDREYWGKVASDSPDLLKLKTMTVAEIDTDPAQATDMNRRTVTMPPELGLNETRFGKALGDVVGKAVDVWYNNPADRPEQSPKDPIDEGRKNRMNGERPNGIQDGIAYKARPLDGIWATPPYLHNGSVPNVYALLSPQRERPQSFQLGRRDYDPVCMGYHLNAVPPDETDTVDPKQRCLDPTFGQDRNRLGPLTPIVVAPAAGAIRGNLNTGHQFAAPKGSDRNHWGKGIVGEALHPAERLAIIAFLKTDCANGSAAEKIPPDTKSEERERILKALDRTTCEDLRRLR